MKRKRGKKYKSECSQTKIDIKTILMKIDKLNNYSK